MVEQAAFLSPTSLFLLLNVVIATILLSSALTHHRRQRSGDISATAALPPLARTPSLFSRVTSFNFSNYYPQEYQGHDQLNHSHSSPSLFYRVASFNFSGRGNEESTRDVDREVAPAMACCLGLGGMATAHAKVGEIDAHPGNKNSKFGLESNPAPVSKNVTCLPSLLSRVASFGLSRQATNVQVGEVDTHPNCGGGGSSSSSVGSPTTHMKKKKKKKKKSGMVANKETVTFRSNAGEVDAKAEDFINRFKHQLKLQRTESLMRSKTAQLLH